MGMGLGSKIKAAMNVKNGRGGKAAPIRKNDIVQSQELIDFMGVPFPEEPPSTVDIIESVLVAETEETHFLAPSGLFKCPRACVFQYRNAHRGRAPISPKLNRIMDEGNHVHSILQRYLGNERHKYWFIPEAKNFCVIDGVNVSGSCDGILIRRSDGYRWAIEIKSISDNGWEKLKTSPESEHAKQGTLYAMSQKIWWVTILYWNKNSQELREYPIPVTNTRYEKIKARIAALKPYVLDPKGKSLPQFVQSQCNTMFCKFIKVCEQNGGTPVVEKDYGY